MLLFDASNNIKALGKTFREGISLIELFEMFPDDTTAERWFEKQRWGEAGKSGGAGRKSTPVRGNLTGVPRHV